MNEIINPPCNSLLVTFFELSFEICLKKASSCLRRLIRPKRILRQFLKLLFPLPLMMPPKKRWLERGEESPVGCPKGPNEVGCETEAGTVADVEDEDEDVDVVGCIDEVGISGYESECFTLSEVLRRKRLAKKKVSEGVVGTFHFPQCEFSNLQHLPLALLLEVLFWPVIEFF